MTNIERTVSEKSAYRELFEHAGDAIFIHDLEGYFLEVNRAACERLGYSRESLLCMSVPEIDDPAYASLVPQRIAMLQERGECIIETAHITADGQLLPVELSSRVIEYRGQPAVLSIARDIRERRQAEHFLQSTLDALSAHIAILNADGEILAVNRSWRRFGDENDFSWENHGVGSNYLEVCEGAAEQGAAAAAAAAAGIRQIIAGEREEFHLEYDCHAPFEERWFAMRVTRFSTNESVNVVVAHEKITERRKAEEALRASEARYRTISALTSDITYAAQITPDSSLIWEWVTEASEEITGYTLEMLRTLNDHASWQEIVHPDDVVQAQAQMQAAVAGKTDTREFRLMTLRDEVRYVRSYVQPAPHKKNGNTLIYGAIQDITERKKAVEAQEVRFRKMIEQNADGILIVDEKGLVRFINRAAESLLGCSAEEILDQEVGFPLMGEGRTTIDIRRNDGKAITAEMRVVQTQWEEQPAYLASLRDVTEGRQMEEALRIVAESGVASGEDIFRFLVRQLAISQGKRHAMIAGVDQDDPTTAYTLAVWSEGAFAENFSYDLEGTPCRQVIRKGPCLYPRKVAERFPKDELLVEMGVESYWGTPLHDSTGKVLGVMILLDDRPMEENPQTFSLLNSFAARASAELERRRTEEKYRLLHETMVQGVVYQDATGRVTSVNPAAERILGLSLEELRGRTSFAPRGQAIREDGTEIPQDEHPSMVALRTGEEVHHRTLGVFNPQENEYRWIVVHAVPQTRPGESGPYQVYSIFEDVTPRKRAEQVAEWESRVRAAMADLSQALLTTASLEEISDLVLEWSKWLTDSQFGYVGYIDPPTGNLVSTTMTRDIWEECEVAGKDVVFHSFKGLWGWVLDHQRPLLTNEPLEDSRSTGIPAGHIPIERFLSAPAMVGKKMVGQIALANAARDYTLNDLALVERLAALYALAVQKQRTEAELRKYAEEQAALYAVSTAVTALQDPEVLLSNVLAVILSILDAQAGWVSRPSAGEKPQIVASKVVPGMVVDIESAADVVNCPIYTDVRTAEHPQDIIEGCPHFEEAVPDGRGGLHICVPLRAAGETLGVLTLLWTEGEGEVELAPSFLRTIGQQVGIALHNAELYQQARQLDRLQVLTALDNALSASLDPEHVTRATLTQVAEALRATRGTLLLCRTGAEICLERSLELDTEGLSPLRAHNAIRRLRALMQGLDERQQTAPFTVCELQKLGFNGQIEELHGWRAEDLIAPIWNAEGLIGLLMLGRRRGERRFSDEDEALVQAAANRAGQALRNAQLYQASRDQSERLTHLNTISQVAVSSLDPETVLRQILELTTKVLDAAEGSILLQSENHDGLSFALTLGEEARGLHGLDLAPGQGIAGWVVEQNRGALVPHAAADPRFYAGVDQHTGFTTESLLGAPLRHQGEVIGVIEIVNRRRGNFTEGDLRLLEAVASIAAVALQNARLYTETRARAEELEMLNTFGLTLTSTLNFEEVTESALDQIRRLFRADMTSLLQLDTEVHELLHLGSMTAEGPRTAPLHLAANKGIAGWALTHHEPVLVADAAADPRFWPALDNYLDITSHSYMAVPLFIQDRAMGVLTVMSHEVGHYTEKDLQTLQAFASSLAVALENARLYDELKNLLRQREQAQAQLIHAEKMSALGRLGASIAHEINNPLQAIQGCLTLAEEELDEEFPQLTHNSSLTDYLHIADTEIDRISSIVRRMRDFYRPARQRMETTDITEVVESVLALTRKQLEHAEIRIVCQLDEDLPPIEANPDHLKQIFLNLVLNSVDAMPEGGTLELRATRDSLERGGSSTAAVRIELEDTGVGMDADTLSRLFEPFFTTKEQGSGLGLSISYGLIQAHNGEISARSQVGEGTTFSLLLPIDQD